MGSLFSVICVNSMYSGVKNCFPLPDFQVSGKGYKNISKALGLK